MLSKMKLSVKDFAGETVTLDIKQDETFKSLKKRVVEAAGVTLDLDKIAIKGKKIVETERVIDYFLSKQQSPNDQICSVPGCRNSKRTNPEKVFFEFPADNIRCHQWVLFCQRLHVGHGRSRLILTAESTICNDHFKPDQFVKNTSTLLKRTAVPCIRMAPFNENIFTSSEIETSIDSPLLLNDVPKEYFSDESQDSKKAFRLSERLCRLCSSACDDYIFIFDEYGKALKIAEKINLCLPVNVGITDCLPKQICRGCLSQLNALFEFFDTCSLTQQKLSGLMNASFHDEEEDNVELGICVSKQEDKENLLNDCCPLCTEGQMKPFEESHLNLSSDVFKISDSKKDVNCYDSLNDTIINGYTENLMKNSVIHFEDNDIPDLRPQTDLSVTDEPNNNDVVKLNFSTSKNFNDSLGEWNSNLGSPMNAMSSEDFSCESVVEDNLSKLEKKQQELHFLDNTSNNLKTQIEDDEKSLDQTLFCRICAEEFHSNNDLLIHSFAHSFRGFYQCNLCISVFSCEQDLVNHFSEHINENPSNIGCNACGKLFKVPVSLASHDCKLSLTNNCKCTICKKIFPSDSKFTYHMKFHHGLCPVNCNICSKLFSSKKELEIHKMKAHNSEELYFCFKCHKSFKSETSLRYHRRVHKCDDQLNLFKCEQCGKTFIRKNMLLHHMVSQEHLALKMSCFSCKVCFEAFPSTGAAVSHMDNRHTIECSTESAYTFNLNTLKRVYVCEFCERCFAERHDLNLHRDKHPNESAYECKVCSAVYSNFNDVSEHRTVHENEKLPVEYLVNFNLPKIFSCEFCERQFLDRLKYTEHQTIHYGPEPYQCRYCPMTFSSLLSAEEHRVTHIESISDKDDYDLYKPYECHFCNKSFAIEDALVKHIRMHTGEKPFICDKCGKGFSQSSGLYTHHKVHSSERPYSCSFCPRKFKIKGDRDVHVRKHSGDRPYKCEYCGKAFMTQHVYSQHRKIHTGERPYKCDVCGIAFRRSHVLTVHKRIHTGEKPNICDVCGKCYRQKGDMLKHKRLQHSIAVRSLVQLQEELSSSIE